MTRTSEASLALITLKDTRRKIEYLTQWNENWNAYSLIGGHLEIGESFRECCEREIIEELECQASQIQLATIPLTILRFREFSDSAGGETDYEWQIFTAELDKAVLQNFPSNCAWVTSSQVEAGHIEDGRPIARQVKRVLHAIESIHSGAQSS